MARTRFYANWSRADGRTVLTLRNLRNVALGSITIGVETDAITLEGGTWAGTAPPAPNPTPNPPPPVVPDPNLRHLYVAVTGNDGGAGTYAAPYRTIGKAASVVTPGTVVHVAPGVYTEHLYTRVDGASGKPILFVSDEPKKAIIKPSGASGAIWRSDGDFVDIQGFDINGTASQSVRTGLYVTGAHSAVLGCEVHHIYQSGANDSQGGGGIVLGGGYFKHSDQHAIGNHVHHVGGGGHFQGIYHQSTGSIVNNLIHNIAGMGVSLWHDPHDITITNNTVFDCSYGIGFGAGDWYGPQNPADNIRVTHNIVYGCNYGIGDMGSVGKNVVVDRNMSVANRINYNLQSGAPHTNDVTGDRAAAERGISGMGYNPSP